MIPAVLEELTRHVWALPPASLDAMIASTRPGYLAAGKRAMAVQRIPRVSGAGGVAIVPVYGLLMPRASFLLEFFGGTAMTAIVEAVRLAAANPDVRVVVLDVDSPGGSFAGCEETWEALRAVATIKPLVAVSNYLCASAAFFLASAASAIAASPSSELGSIGVYGVYLDQSGHDEMQGLRYTFIGAPEFKTENSGHQPLSKEAQGFMEQGIRSAYGDFIRCVAAGRRTSMADVATNYGRGRVLNAREAVRAGMADRIATLEDSVKVALGLAKPESRGYALLEAELQRRRHELDVVTGQTDLERRKAALQCLRRKETQRMRDEQAALQWRLG